VEVHILPISEDEVDEAAAAMPWRSRAVHRERLERQDRGEFTYLIARVDGRPAGHVGVRWPSERDVAEFQHRHGCAEVEDLFVTPPCRGRGIGRALMERAEAETRLLALPSIGLATGQDEGYAAARHLYRTLGYHQVSGLFIQSNRTPSDAGERQFWLDVLTYWVKNLT
jgi:GNAT superfamily N-acetyltransferase